MNKIYLIISTKGQYDDRLEKVEKAFSNIKKAEEYICNLEDEERIYRDMAERCRECAGLDKTCPYYVEPDDLIEECDNYNPYHDNTFYRIEETELV